MSNQPSANEKELLIRLKQGDQKAFKEIFTKYSTQIYNVSFQYLHSKAESEEIIQEVFFKVWLHRTRIKEDQPFAPYVVSIAKNLIFNKSRRRIVEEAYVQYLSSRPRKLTSNTENSIRFSEVKKITDLFIEGLPLVRKEVFKLSRIENLSNKEIASQLKITERTVENHIYRALKSLKSHLRNRGYIEIALLVLHLY